MIKASNKISVAWDKEEPSVVRATLHDDWTWEDLYTVNNEIISMMRSTDETVHLILDFTGADAIPVGGVIMHARNILGAYPSNCDLRIVVTRNALVQRLMNIFQAAFQTGLGKYVYTVSTIDEAYHLMRKHTRVQVNVL